MMARYGLPNTSSEQIQNMNCVRGAGDGQENNNNKKKKYYTKIVECLSAPKPECES